MTEFDLVEHVFRACQIVIDGIDRRGRTGAVDKTDRHVHRTGDPAGTEGGIEILAGIDVPPEFRRIGVGRMTARHETCDISEVGNTAEGRFDVL